MALGLYGMGMGGTVLGALTAPRIADQWGLTAPFIVAMILVAATAAVFWLLARDAPVPRPAATGGMFSSLRVFRDRPAAWAPTFYYFLVFGGFVAMFAYLPKLLTSVHDLDKPDAAARAAGFALVAVIATALLAIGLAPLYDAMVPLTILCLTLAGAFGLGTGAVFKLVAQDFPDQVGAVTGVVGAAGGLGGFFPPLVMALFKSTTGDYFLGFALLAVTAVAALVVLQVMGRRASGGRRADLRVSEVAGGVGRVEVARRERP
jgi:NNP family nitrate/nitrite transporter-like MFS transporter